jgi:four helix bundle protein
LPLWDFGCRQLPRRRTGEEQSRADFIYKLRIVEEEADEALFWLEMIGRAGILPSARLEPLISEGSEILAIIVSSIRTAKRNKS